MLPFPAERQHRSTAPAARLDAAPLRRSGGRAIRYFQDVHGAVRLGHADGVAVHTDERCRSTREQGGPPSRFVVCTCD